MVSVVCLAVCDLNYVLHHGIIPEGNFLLNLILYILLLFKFGGVLQLSKFIYVVYYIGLLF